ncbi:MAG TPA: TMEM175 family protein [Chloroflexia bacterium]|nr:TMEM175 family protein [Chloroflexia bacterium]
MSEDVAGPVAADGRGTTRLEAFSDGVFAIAVTLLVLDIKVPEIAAQADASALRDALLDQWPRYASYTLSFITLGIVWANHNRMFAHIARTNHTFLILNVVFLLLIGVYPFPTSLLARYIEYPDKQQLVTLIYLGLSTLTSICYSALWSYASGPGHLLDAHTSPAWVRRLTWRNRAGLVLFTAAFLLAFVSVYLSLILFCCLVGFYLLPAGLTGLDS